MKVLKPNVKDMKSAATCEDIDLTPEQIMELKERDTEKMPIYTESGMKCPVCGGNVMLWEIFCNQCGQRLWENDKWRVEG